MRQGTWWMAVAVFGFGLTACSGELERVDGMRGALGGVAFTGQPEVREVEVTRTHLFVDLRLANIDEQWAVMLGVAIPRGGEVGSVGLALEGIEGIGCSGAYDGEWEYDCEPKEIQVEAHETENGISLDVGATFDPRCDGSYDGPTAVDVPEGGFDGPTGYNMPTAENYGTTDIGCLSNCDDGEGSGSDGSDGSDGSSDDDDEEQNVEASVEVELI